MDKMKLIIITLIATLSLNGKIFLEDDKEATCLALNIYHEARSSMEADQYAVADVVLNRVDSINYPNSICEVVKESVLQESWRTKKNPLLSKKERKYFPKRNMCQFSWYCDGKDDTPTDIDAWEKAKLISLNILDKDIHRGITSGSTHYHAYYVKPNWASTFDLVGTIGAHKYYREVR